MAFVPPDVSFDLLRQFADRLQDQLRPDDSIMAAHEALARAAGYPHAHALNQAAQRWRADQATGVPLLPSVSPRRVKEWAGPFRKAWLAGGQGAVLPALAKSWGHASVAALQEALLHPALARVSVAPLVALGMTTAQAKDWMDAVLTTPQERGWLFSGITAAGKTTTMRTTVRLAAQAEPGGDLPIYAGVPELPLSEALPIDDPDEGWGRTLRLIMQHHPRWVMIGEVRTSLTAQAVFESLYWGLKRVFTTLHDDDAWSAWARLVKRARQREGHAIVELSMIGGSCHQRLIRRVCPHCSVPFKATSALGRTLAGHLGDGALAHMRQQGAGCARCDGRGFVGWTGAFELILPALQPGLVEVIRTEDWAGAQRLWRTQSDGSVLSPRMRGKTVLEHAWHKVAMGEACPLEVTDRVGPATLGFGRR